MALEHDRSRARIVLTTYTGSAAIVAAFASVARRMSSEGSLGEGVTGAPSTLGDNAVDDHAFFWYLRPEDRASLSRSAA